ncbi:hypothetical protein LB467_07895 [Salegentibacter sp. JZCK2]|uniref:hypothetical protein n=1 Tax=Salegentibacter tibetensis TaxID=2873600 RepID=UPI001CCB241A|nr:hypothetical protein [Salegentibacter tibetensis]MBZ9729610.1 hypothetical protein [Salegentibacter tibetensis]
MKTLLYITDLYYVAKGRNYYGEDLFITSRLKPHFNILIAHPQQAIAFLDNADFLVFRNTGSVIGYEKYFQDFLEAVKQKNIPTFNSFDGKADIRGKQYLLDLQGLDYPVIPTVEDVAEIHQFGFPEKYIVKIKNGADSIGMELLTKEKLLNSRPVGKLIQPFIDFEYEVSFYYLNDRFQYAMYAPNKEKRWELAEYHASPEDLEFAEKFINWNQMERGVTRVDACRLRDKSLLLVELEDLNPFLSLELLPEEKKNRFIDNLITALKEIAPNTNVPSDYLA